MGPEQGTGKGFKMNNNQPTEEAPWSAFLWVLNKGLLCEQVGGGGCLDFISH